jgi:hypothetical protein
MLASLVTKSVVSPYPWTTAYPRGDQSAPTHPYPQVWESLADAFALLGEDDATLHVPTPLYDRLPFEVRCLLATDRRVRRVVGTVRFARVASVQTVLTDDPSVPYPVLVGAVRGVGVAVTRVVEARGPVLTAKSAFKWANT